MQVVKVSIYLFISSVQKFNFKVLEKNVQLDETKFQFTSFPPGLCSWLNSYCHEQKNMFVNHTGSYRKLKLFVFGFSFPVNTFEYKHSGQQLKNTTNEGRFMIPQIVSIQILQ